MASHGIAVQAAYAGGCGGERDAGDWCTGREGRRGMHVEASRGRGGEMGMQGSLGVRELALFSRSRQSAQGDARPRPPTMRSMELRGA
jgi:hypothetical protein